MVYPYQEYCQNRVHIVHKDQVQNLYFVHSVHKDQVQDLTKRVHLRSD